MNSSDIQNALDRIIKQNRNLDESGLRVLLLASSWDEETIEKAIVVFKDRKDSVLSSLSNDDVKDVVGASLSENSKEDDEPEFLLKDKDDISKVINEVKINQGEKIVEKQSEIKNEAKKEDTQVEVEARKEELVLPPSNMEASLGDLLSSSLKEIDKIPDKVFEDKRSKGIDLEKAPILVKNDGVSSVADLKKEAIRNVLEGKKVEPVKVNIPPVKQEPVVIKQEKSPIIEVKKEEVSLKKEEIPTVKAEIKIETTPKKEEIVLDKKLENNKDTVLIQSGEAPSDHLIPDEETMEKEEKTSLVKDLNEIPKKISNKAIEEIPHNLPLKPFDASPHVVPFSEYKKSFHGKTEEDKIEVVNQPSVVKQVPVIPSQNYNVPKVTKLSRKHAPLSKSEKELIVTATTLLFFILLLLSYMYSNGRL